MSQSPQLYDAAFVTFLVLEIKIRIQIFLQAMQRMTANTINLYQDFNVQGIRTIRDDEAVADCPFCGKTGHFYFNKDGQYHCKICCASGNAVTFLRNRHGKSNTEIHEILMRYGLSEEKRFQRNRAETKYDIEKLFKKISVSNSRTTRKALRTYTNS